MSATDELRRLLDERGVAWGDLSDFGIAATEWRSGDGSPCNALESDERPLSYVPDGKLSVQANLTPEQAVETTLGRGTCRIKPWKMERDTGFYDCMECECGYVSDVSDWAKWHYCPNCGRKVVDA